MGPCHEKLPLSQSSCVKKSFLSVPRKSKHLKRSVGAASEWRWQPLSATFFQTTWLQDLVLQNITNRDHKRIGGIIIVFPPQVRAGSEAPSLWRLRRSPGTTSASSATSARTPWSARDLFRWGSTQFIKWVFYAHGWYLHILGKG